MNEKNKRELIGTVVSDKGDKTITVLVETYEFGLRCRETRWYLYHQGARMGTWRGLVSDWCCRHG